MRKVFIDDVKPRWCYSRRTLRRGRMITCKARAARCTRKPSPRPLQGWHFPKPASKFSLPLTATHANFDILWSRYGESKKFRWKIETTWLEADLSSHCRTVSGFFVFQHRHDLRLIFDNHSSKREELFYNTSVLIFDFDWSFPQISVLFVELLS